MDTDREDRVRQRAYHLWEQAGGPDGRHLDHWESAEHEIDAEDKPSAAKSPMADPGSPGGTSGTGGTAHDQDG